MSSSLRAIQASAAITHYQGRVLLTLKPNWDRYSVPITKQRDGETGEQAAGRCIEEDLGFKATEGLGLLLDTPVLQTNPRTHQIGGYEIQCYAYETSSVDLPPDTIGKWLTPDEILAASNNDVSETAQELVKQLKEAALDGRRSFPPTASIRRRMSTACVAIVRRESMNGPEWLAQHNTRWGRYFLVGGHEGDGEKKTECMLRELNEELRVAPSDVELGQHYALNYTAWSTGSWQWTKYKITAIDVSFPDVVLEQITSRPENRWLTPAEIRSERTRDNKLISPTMRFVLKQLGELDSE